MIGGGKDRNMTEVEEEDTVEEELHWSVFKTKKERKKKKGVSQLYSDTIKEQRFEMIETVHHLMFVGTLFLY